MTCADNIRQLATWIAHSSETVFFGGAGVSTESGIPDFRSAAGLYAQQHDGSLPPEYLLSHECLVNYPEQFYDFHRTKLLHPQARPNPAHLALAELESRGRLRSVITQNIDGLHQLAGSRTVRELHGSVHHYTCVGCHQPYGLTQLPSVPVVPACPECGEMIRPDVVLYGEALDDAVVAAAVADIQAAEVLIVGGTSLNVYPAAGLLRYFRGTKLVLINLEGTPFDAAADLVIRDRIGAVFGEVMSLVNK
ncbi:NAD-dependent protein deacylase [Corynebacterium uterequi]|uniref:NAD-dependent protein deacylase n=1 Tax=Corynebacterium uterequi TaxID=1072256 RepID=UPI000AE4B8C4|nr:NAD-dependent protein deacylase [Corynebacterium uterequi]